MLGTIDDILSTPADLSIYCLLRSFILLIISFLDVKISCLSIRALFISETLSHIGITNIQKNIIAKPAKNNPKEFAFAWVLDFPLFVEQSEEDYFHGAGDTWAPSHHMFTAPKEEDIHLLEANPGKVRAYQHDMVLNGFEVGGGSVRIHDPKVQEKIFDLIGFTAEQKQQFAHMLTAFTYGVPPHGGIAPGIDRLTMLLAGEKNLREVTAFPLTGDGRDPMMDSPSRVAGHQLDELGIEIKKQ